MPHVAEMVGMAAGFNSANPLEAWVVKVICLILSLFAGGGLHCHKDSFDEKAAKPSYGTAVSLHERNSEIILNILRNGKMMKNHQ